MEPRRSRRVLGRVSWSRHSGQRRGASGPRLAPLLAVAAAVLVACSELPPTGPPGGGGPPAPLPSPSAPPGPGIAPFEARTLDGSGNNLANPTWGAAGQPYRRLGPASYAAADGTPFTLAASPRAVSNRIVNDSHQNLFSARGVTQWTWLWGQFVDHTIGLRDGRGPEAPLAFDAADPLEEFTNDFGAIPFTRSLTTPGPDGTPEQTNLVSSYIDAFNVYGGDLARLEWLRDGPVDGDLSNNAATLLSTDDGYLPMAAARPDLPAPSMDVPGRLRDVPGNAVIAGDQRANENIGLTGVQTLFLREHNRIVGLLPAQLDEQAKFEIARRLVGAELQYVTYTEFLPAVGVALPEYAGYRPDVDPTLTNEFATVGYRAHSMIHGEIETEVELGRYTPEQIVAFEDRGVEVAETATALELAVPLNVAFTSPELVPAIGLGPLLAGFSGERQYRNDEMIDNQLRSVLFMNSREGIDLAECLDGPLLATCFSDGVLDLGTLDVMRALDHGISSYNDLRATLGLPRRTAFTEVTGEATDAFPADPEVDALDPFIGMVSEPHVEGTELGELQLAMWVQQFSALRDGDRFFHLNDPVLAELEAEYGLTYRRTLREILLDNTDLQPDDLPPSVFFAAPEAA